MRSTDKKSLIDAVEEIVMREYGRPNIRRDGIFIHICGPVVKATLMVGTNVVIIQSYVVDLDGNDLEIPLNGLVDCLNDLERLFPMQPAIRMTPDKTGYVLYHSFAVDKSAVREPGYLATSIASVACSAGITSIQMNSLMAMKKTGRRSNSTGSQSQ